ncbi:hypothetical protein GX865_00220 [Candidatus Saccharibacteria bacterium]|nr:hypothetical protein [Candidatus Saccharibacteria bacterium]
MKFSLKGVVVGLTIVLMLVLNLAPNAQAVDANSNHNEVTVDNVSYADVQELLNDSRIDQGAVRELANSRTSTAADFDSLFALWGVNIKDWPVPLQQVIDFIRQIFGIDRAQDPVHDPDTVPAGEIPGISSRASFTLLCYGEDEVLFDHRAEAKYRGVYSGYLVDSDGSML